MTKGHRPTLSAGTHIVFDTADRNRLRDLGVTNLVRANGSTTVGPSRRDIVEHARLRQEWFHTTETWDDLHSADVRWEMPVIVWVTPNFQHRLELWRTCSGLRDKGIAHQDILIVDLPSLPRSPDAPPLTEPFQSYDCVFYHSDEALTAHLSAARPCTRERYDKAVALWEKFVDPDPRPFVRSCRQGLAGFPELGSIWAFLSHFFPRLSTDGSLRLSRYDELLLEAMSVRWRTPVKVYIHLIREHYPFMSCMGDLTVTFRLAAWAEHDARPAAVERAPDPKKGPEDLMLSSIYRLTKHGKQVRERLTDLTDAPRLPVGGTEAYAPESPWVLREDGRLVRL
jgi:hypothetical protein